MPTFAQPPLAIATFSVASTTERERTTSEVFPPITALGAAVGAMGSDVVGSVCASLEAHHSALSLLLAAADRGAVLLPPSLRDCLERAAATLPGALERGASAGMISAVA